MLTRHLLHLSNDEMVCVPWKFGRPVAEHRFRADAEGQDAFARYLQQWQNVPVLLAVDLIEEDFRIETLPHLRGSDRRIVTERRLGQIYRGTPFRMAIQQGRETQGRRDDILLCTAITQSEGLAGWLDLLQAARIPLLGVYPTALLGENLLRGIGLAEDQVMLVTPLGQGAVRISFFQHGRLKFSRISEPSASVAADRMERIRDETRKTLQYVAAQPWYLRNLSQHTLVIADVEDARRVTSQWGAQDAAVQAITPGTLARRLRMRAMPEGASATAILLNLLMQRVPRGQLAPRERTRDGLLWYARTSLFGLSALLGVAGCAVAAVDLVHALQVRDQQGPLQAEVMRSRNELSRLQRALPPSLAAPDRMSAAVHFYRHEVMPRPSLQTILQPVSQALGILPGITLQRLSWTITAQPPPAKASLLRDLGSVTVAAEPVQQTSGSHPFFIDLRIDAETPGLNNQPAAALQASRELAGQLQSLASTVQVLRPPFDGDPAHPLAGDALAGSPESPHFTLRVVTRMQP